MTKNIFTSQRSHTRIKFQPLATSCALVCLTPQSPLAQIRKTDGTYMPTSRKKDGGVPCVIFPDVRAFDPDKVFRSGAANEYLSIDAGVMQWTVNGNPIETEWSTGKDYDIMLEENDTRGTLKVYKDLDAGEQAVLRFAGRFLDWRTGLLYPVVSNDIVLTCTEKGEDQITCSVDKPIVAYDPLRDKALLNDYLAARGLPSMGEDDGRGYVQTVSAVMVEGNEAYAALPDGTTMELAYVGNETAITPKSTASPEVLEVAYPNIRIDMRLVSSIDYEVRFMREGKKLASVAFNAASHASMPANGIPLFQADIPASATVYRNRVLINLADRKVDYPEVYYSIRWETQARREITVNNVATYVAAEPVSWQRGENMTAPIEELGIGRKKDNSCFDVMFSCEPHDVQQVLASPNGEPFMDENGDFLIG